MLIVGGSGNNRGALLGAIMVWGFWTLSGALVASLFPIGQCHGKPQSVVG